MIVTDYLARKDPSLKVLPEVRSTDYHMFNDGGVECEVGEFLYGLVCALRPDYILETGTHKGISASYMGLALTHNAKGHLYTIEINADHVTSSKKRWKRLGVENRVFPVNDSSLRYGHASMLDLIFLDSEPEIRWKEFDRFYPRLKAGGYVFIHDTPPNLCQGNVNTDHPKFESWPFGNITEKMREVVREKKVFPIHLPTPRGLIGFYKNTKEDFKW